MPRGDTRVLFSVSRVLVDRTSYLVNFGPLTSPTAQCAVGPALTCLWLVFFRASTGKALPGKGQSSGVNWARLFCAGVNLRATLGKALRETGGKGADEQKG